MSTSHPAELQLLDYVEGSLTGEELRGLRRHVGTCSACQETLRELSHAVDALERLPTVGIPHDGMRISVARNRRKLWMRALPILAIVLAAGAVVQELRPSASEPNADSRSAAAMAAERLATSSTKVVTHVSAARPARAGVAAALAGFHASIVADRGGLLAVVDLDDLAGAEQGLRHSQGRRTVAVVVIGVEGLNAGVQRERIGPGAPTGGDS
jgi:anti-sigma factor RsiW